MLLVSRTTPRVLLSRPFVRTMATKEPLKVTHTKPDEGRPTLEGVATADRSVQRSEIVDRPVSSLTQLLTRRAKSTGNISASAITKVIPVAAVTKVITGAAATKVIPVAAVVVAALAAIRQYLKTDYPKGRDAADAFLTKTYAERPDQVGNVVMKGVKGFRDQLARGGFSNLWSGEIGRHYEFEAKPILDLPSNPRHLAALACLETHYWENEPDQRSQDLGRAMDKLQRFAVLSQTRKEGAPALDFSLFVKAVVGFVKGGFKGALTPFARTDLLTAVDLQAFQEGSKAVADVLVEHSTNGVFDYQKGVAALKQELLEAQKADQTAGNNE